MALIKLTKSDHQLAEELAAKGISNIDISHALHIGEKTFYEIMKRDKGELSQSIKKGKAILKDKVASALLAKATEEKDTTALIFLSKRLNLFVNDIPKIALKDAKTAQEALVAVINADIPIEQKKAITDQIEKFSKQYELIQLEERIAILEKEN